MRIIKSHRISITLILVFWFLASSIFNAQAQNTEAQTSEPTQNAVYSADFSTLENTGTARVEQIISPLTLRLKDGRIISLAGIDIPDNDMTKPGIFAITAMQILDDALTGQDIILFQTKDKTRGRINRMQHHVVHIARKSDNLWAQGLLIKLGLARVMTSPSNSEMASAMLGLEQQSRAQKSGFWENDLYTIKTPETISAHPGRLEIAQGQIKSAAMKKNRIYLNFGNDWRNDFTVSIAPEYRREFIKAGIDPLSLNGKEIRVRGWVQDYNGPLIEITHPAALEILDQAP